jgi:hypothetical protein
MDWSERRFHLAGRLGALICQGCLDHGWLRRLPKTRALEITPPGQIALRNWLGSELWQGVPWRFQHQDEERHPIHRRGPQGQGHAAVPGS